MKRSLWIKLALLFCALITAVAAPHASLAYLAASSNTLTNSFRVVYQPPEELTVPVRINKSLIALEGAAPTSGVFTFRLVNVDTGESYTVTSAGDGTVQIDLTFTEEDAGRTFRFWLCEQNDGVPGILYDDKVYEICITVLLSDAHELVAELQVNGEQVTEIVAEYVNIAYKETPLPSTGDSARLLLWAAMAVIGGAGLIALNSGKKAHRRNP